MSARAAVLLHVLLAGLTAVTQGTKAEGPSKASRVQLYRNDTYGLTSSGDGVIITSCQGDSDDVFHCDVNDKKCIPRNLVCNAISECPNSRDEAVELCGCLPTEFQCNATTCIDLIHRCDTFDDCEDGSDEKGCESYPCPHTHQKCGNHKCVPADKACDFVDDCGDNTDESNCVRRMCVGTEFRCNNEQCVPVGVLCDGNRDCADGSDENVTNCDGQFRCPNTMYIASSQQCDGWVDCILSHQDEANCLYMCKPGYMKCDNGQCISPKHVCDGVCDCRQCEDERLCAHYACSGLDGKFLCLAGLVSQKRCMDRKYVCDGSNDCLDAGDVTTDEYFCHNASRGCENSMLAAHFPVESLVWCSDGLCLPPNYRCDYVINCPDGVDEMGCDYPACGDGEYRCSNNQCIPSDKHCDGVPDCIDRSDEEDCASVPCPANHRRCNNGQCIPNHQWCDYWRDCRDQSDEANCRYDQTKTCADDEFRCDSGQCISREYVCYNGSSNFRNGCADRSHLVDCRDWQCGPGQFKCRISYCVDHSQVCDDVIDCVITFADEHHCLRPCMEGQCKCVNDTMDCRNQALHQVPDARVEHGHTLLLSGNNLNGTLSKSTFEGLSRLLFLDLSNTSLTSLPAGVFSPLWRLSTLKLENNSLTTLSNGSFLGLSNVQQIYLAGNRIRYIEPYAFSGLGNLKSLDLSGQVLTTIPHQAFIGLRSVYFLSLAYNNLTYLEEGVFNGLDNLQKLDISKNRIELIDKTVFYSVPSLQDLTTDEFRFCCLASGVARCLPEPDEFSSCEDLMSNFVLRVSIWVLGMVASFGNLLVIGWRARDLSGGKVHSFLITNLAVGDFLMGVYLMIIAVVDSYYRGVYIAYDKFWRDSGLCRFAGFISMFSSELSVFTLTVITLDRLICILFPLKLRRLGLKEAVVVMAILWHVVFLLALLPLVGIPYFRSYYGRSGVCLALHVTPSRPPGWEYSVGVFLALNFLSFIIIATAYAWMFVVARKTRSAVRASESKSDAAMARRMTLIVMTDFCCWIPIILLGLVSLGGTKVPNEVYAWIAVFILPLNAAVNPVLYTISTAPFLGNMRKRAYRFRKSFMTSFTMDTKHSYVDDRSTSIVDRKSNYRQMDLIHMRTFNRSPTHSHSDPSEL